jgi:hypothetical protein
MPTIFEAIGGDVLAVRLFIVEWLGHLPRRRRRRAAQTCPRSPNRKTSAFCSSSSIS